MEKFKLNEHPKFNSPAEELDFLRSEVARHEVEAEKRGETVERGQIVKQKIEDYKNLPAEKVLTENLHLPAEQTEALVLKLAPEDHDETMAELLGLLRQKGIKNTLAIVGKLNNSHIEDDFHRFLVEYLQEGHAISHLKERSPLFRALNMALYEIILPTLVTTEQPKSLKEIVSSMEQFFAGLLSIPGKNNRGQNYFTLELAIPNYGEEYSFYASIPIDKRELFEKQILAIFHNAKISEKRDDYNIFNETGGHAAAYAVSGKNPIFPLKTYKNFDHDPLNVVLNSFSKIDRAGEGAALQIIFQPTDDTIAKKYESAIKAIQKGTPIKDAINIAYTTGQEVLGSLKEVFFAREKKQSDSPLPSPDSAVVERIKEKISSPIMKVNIRVASSSRTVAEAESILADIESSFNQFENTLGNRLEFERVKSARLGQFLHNFSYRLFSTEQSIPLNIEEASTIMHFQTTALKGADQLKQTRATASPSPSDLPESGLLLGVNRSRGAEKSIFMTEEDRLRHFYVIGQTGTGKTTLLKNMIAQDIARGNGVCLIDPHGLDIMDVLSLVPPERYDDVIYFDPSYTARPMALNMLEYDERYPEQKTFVVNELFNIFQKLYGAVPESMGPMFEQYFRNATMLVIEDPASGSTLLDVSRVLSDKAYRQLKLSRCHNPVIVQFWREVAEKAGGEGALANIVPYITSKFDVFLANDFMRPIVAQEKSVFNFRQIMDDRKILLVNLAKGRLGDINANLIGLILVGKILMATLSRVDSLGQDLPSFYFYIDEFQNVITDSIATILSEARKYKLSLNVAHQFIAQLDEKIRDSVFGNVGSIVAFRVGSDDAEYLEKQFAPTFTAQDLMNIDNCQAYVKLLVNGKPVKPFDLSVLPPEHGSSAKIEALKQLSYTKYGRDRAEVEALILAKYQKPNLIN
jgi:hypothetical protein